MPSCTARSRTRCRGSSSSAEMAVGRRRYPHAVARHRKCRPASFAEVVGQEYVARARPVRWAQTGLLLVLMATGCAGGGRDNPPHSRLGTDVALDANVEVAEDAVTVSYTATNRAADQVLLLNRPARRVGAGTRYSTTNWLTTDGGRSVVEVSQRAVPAPADSGLMQDAVLGVTELSRGQAVQVTFRVPRPLQARGPYPAERALPEHPREVRFCLGAVREDPAAGLVARRGAGVADEVPAVVTHSPSWAAAQTVLCTEPVALS